MPVNPNADDGATIETYEDVHGPGPAVACDCCGRAGKPQRYALYRVTPKLHQVLMAARRAFPDLEAEMDVNFDAEWICDGTWQKLQGRWTGLGRDSSGAKRCLFTRDMLLYATGASPEVVEETRRVLARAEARRAPKGASKPPPSRRVPTPVLATTEELFLGEGGE